MNGAAEAGAYAGACPRAGQRPDPGDWAGRQVWRQTFGAAPSQNATVYDQGGHMLTATVASGGSGSSREFIWLDDRAVGYVTFNSGGVPSLQYLTTGQIDEPLVLTNSAKTVTWNGYTDPFGLGATFGTPSAILNLRLPGQSFQNETSAAGLSLNGARNYDPTLGRYTQPDPLGIDAGANPYAYVDGDPLNLTDPMGLAPSNQATVQYCLWGFCTPPIPMAPSDYVNCAVKDAFGQCEVNSPSGPQTSPMADWKPRYWPNRSSVPSSKTKANCPPPPEEDECETQLAADRTKCAVAKAVYGAQSAAICYGTAEARNSECRVGGGVHAIRTPLYPWN